MRSLAFFVIPASILFLLVSLGLVADGVAEISKIVKYYNAYGSLSSGGGGGGSGGGGGRGTSTYRPTYSTINSGGGGVFGSAYPSYSGYSPSSYRSYSFSSFDYDSALSSIYSRYSLTRRDEQPTGVAKRELNGSPVIRQVPHSTPAPLIKRVEEQQQQHKLQKRAISSISQAKSISTAILAFYVLQLVVIVALLVTGIIFLIKFRKLDETVQGKITNLQNNNINSNTQNLEQSSELQETSNSIYQRTNLIKKFFTIYIILTVLYFIFGIVSWGLFGSLATIILGVAAATIAFWVFTFLSCVAICVTLVLDRRTSEEDEHALRNPSSFDGGESGSKSDGMITTPSQQHQQPVTMPLPQTPAGWQQSTAQHQQQYSSGTYSPAPQQQQQQSEYPTYTPNNESQPNAPASPPPQQPQQPQSSGPIEGQVYRAVKDEHGNTQMVPVNL